MSDRWGHDVDCLTCCKLLGLKPIIDTSSGEQLFESVRDQFNQVPDYRLVIVDECSMINQGAPAARPRDRSATNASSTWASGSAELR